MPKKPSPRLRPSQVVERPMRRFSRCDATRQWPHDNKQIKHRRWQTTKVSTQSKRQQSPQTNNKTTTHQRKQPVTGITKWHAPPTPVCSAIAAGATAGSSGRAQRPWWPQRSCGTLEPSWSIGGHQWWSAAMRLAAGSPDGCWLSCVFFVFSPFDLNCRYRYTVQLT